MMATDTSLIRFMIRRDHLAVLDIERASYLRPLTPKQLTELVMQKHIIGIVIERDDVVVGHMIYSLEPEEIYLLRLAVRPDVRRQGLGSLMLDRLISKLNPKHRIGISTIMSERNDIGHSFLRKNGFLAKRVVRDFVADGHDGYMFTYELE